MLNSPPGAHEDPVRRFADHPISEVCLDAPTHVQTYLQHDLLPPSGPIPPCTSCSPWSGGGSNTDTQATGPHPLASHRPTKSPARVPCAWEAFRQRPPVHAVCNMTLPHRPPKRAGDSPLQPSPDRPAWPAVCLQVSPTARTREPHRAAPHAPTRRNIPSSGRYCPGWVGGLECHATPYLTGNLRLTYTRTYHHARSPEPKRNRPTSTVLLDYKQCGATPVTTAVVYQVGTRPPLSYASGNTQPADADCGRGSMRAAGAGEGKKGGNGPLCPHW